MNVLSAERQDALRRCFVAGYGVRETARRTGVSRETVVTYRRAFLREVREGCYCRCGRLVTHRGPCVSRRRDRLAHELAAAISRAVPDDGSPAVRAEVCQEMAVRVLAGEVRLGALAPAVRDSVRDVLREYHDRFRSVSLEAPLTDDGALTLKDLLTSTAEFVSPDGWQEEAS